MDWLPALGIRLAFAADGLGLVFSFIALLIGAVVFVYSTRYLAVGRNYAFYQVMTAFTLSMQALVLADDLVLLFICWELTSLASFLLIASAGNAGEGASMRTLLITFVGGVLLLLAIAAIWWRTGTTSLSGVFSHEVWASDPGFTTLIAVLVALAGFTKAAQFPFHVWLPDAMAAITPVSAYLHAAAVVKAGIFLLLRFSPVLHGNAVWNGLLVTVGLITTCVGGYFALEQTDAKKLMAYSTVSQLGLLTASIGLGTEAGIAAAVLHTIAHALFKSGLFMMVGVIDHSTDTRDLRRFPPGLYRRMPFSFAVMALGCASMAGIPPMLGFVSKEAILASLLGAPGASWTGLAAFLVAVLGSVLTFVYCARVLLGIFFDGTDENRSVHMHDPLLAGCRARWHRPPGRLSAGRYPGFTWPCGTAPARSCMRRWASCSSGPSSRGGAGHWSTGCCSIDSRSTVPRPCGTSRSGPVVSARCWPARWPRTPPPGTSSRSWVRWE